MIELTEIRDETRLTEIRATIAAAMESTLYGIPSIALSQMYDGKSNVKWKTAEHWGKNVIGSLIKRDWNSSVLININFPNRLSCINMK